MDGSSPTPRAKATGTANSDKQQHTRYIVSMRAAHSLRQFAKPYNDYIVARDDAEALETGMQVVRAVV
jgi:hypothetical protein